MSKLKVFLFALILLIVPVFVNAESKYVDKVYDIVGENEVLDKVTIYFFHQTSCPHCRSENKFLDELETEYGDKIIVKRYEVSGSVINDEYLTKVKERFGINNKSVPFTVIGEEIQIGFSTTRGYEIKKIIDNYLNGDQNNNNEEENNSMRLLPILGEVDVKKVSIPVVAVILGAIDGFNPCAMWVLLFLINMLFNMRDKKKMWILGFAFLFTSAFIYFLAMLGISVVVESISALYFRIIIALVAIIGGTINLMGYVKTPKDGCAVVDEKKRKKYFTRIKKFTNEKNLFLAILGVIALAASVNVVELACSAGFPSIFISILELNNISVIGKLAYILLYILFYLLDDLIIFVIAMISLKITGITTKYNKVSKLVGGIIMILIGLLLVFKPEWIMLNF